MGSFSLSQEWDTKEGGESVEPALCVAVARVADLHLHLLERPPVAALLLLAVIFFQLGSKEIRQTKEQTDWGKGATWKKTKVKSFIFNEFNLCCQKASRIILKRDIWDKISQIQSKPALLASSQWVCCHCCDPPENANSFSVILGANVFNKSLNTLVWWISIYVCCTHFRFHISDGFTSTSSGSEGGSSPSFRPRLCTSGQTQKKIIKYFHNYLVDLILKGANLWTARIWLPASATLPFP